MTELTNENRYYDIVLEKIQNANCIMRIIFSRVRARKLNEIYRTRLLEPLLLESDVAGIHNYEKLAPIMIAYTKGIAEDLIASFGNLFHKADVIIDLDIEYFQYPS